VLIRVKLPTGPLIPYLAFCKAIAEAIGPKYKNLEGVDCVSGKIYPPDVPTPIIGIAGPYPLDEADRQAFSKVLVELPRLHYPMLEEEVASFMKAYASLASRPPWTPQLVTKETIRERKFEYNRIEDLHLAAIRREHRAGRLVPVGTNHVPLDAVQMAAHLTRKDAVAYLERHGLPYDDEEPVASLKPSSLSSEAGHPSPDVDPLSLNSGASIVGRPKVNDAQRAEAIKRTKELRAAGEKDFMAQVAKEYGVTPRSIHNWVKEDEEMTKKKPTLASLLRVTGTK